MDTTKPDQDKVFFIKAYLDKVRQRIENLAKLNATPSFRDEAFILCLVYVDALAQNYYGGDKVKENFCMALKELSGSALFGKLHARTLLDPDNDKHWASAKTAVEELARSRPSQLLDEAEVAARIRTSSTAKHTQDELIKNLWRYSVAAICYELMRNQAVHRLGTSTLSFDETVYEAKLGFTLTFDLLHTALLRISEHVAKESVEKGEWFGRDDYFKRK